MLLHQLQEMAIGRTAKPIYGTAKNVEPKIADTILEFFTFILPLSF